MAALLFNFWHRWVVRKAPTGGYDCGHEAPENRERVDAGSDGFLEPEQVPDQNFAIG
jgi:hypothetical protein